MSTVVPIDKKLRRDEAEKIAIGILDFIGQDADRCATFLTDTGLAPAEIRNASRSFLFLLGVLDYAMKNEGVLIEACEAIGIEPVAVEIAQRTLAPPGELKRSDKRRGAGPKGLPPLPPRQLFR